MKKIYAIFLISFLLHFAGSAQNVGIGISNPAYKLDVAGDINLTGKIRISGAATANKVLKTDGSGNPVWGDDNNTTYTAGTGIGIAGTVVTNTAPSLWMQSGSTLYPNNAAWNVGIGTSVPGYKLHTEGDAYFSTRIGVGTAPSSSRMVNIAGSISSNGDRRGINNTLTITDAALTTNRAQYGIITDVINQNTSLDGFTLTQYGGFNRSQNSADNAVVSAFYGSYNQALQNNATATATTGYGSYNYARNQNGNLTTSYGGYNYSHNQANTVTTSYGTFNYARNQIGTVTSAIGAYNYAHNQENTMATARGSYNRVRAEVGEISTGYGVESRLEQISGVFNTGYLFYGSYTGTFGTKWGTYMTGETKNYFSGNVGIGTTDPQAKLDIRPANGTASIQFASSGNSYPRVSMGGTDANVAFVINRLNTSATQYFGEDGDAGGFQFRGSGATRIGSLSGTDLRPVYATSNGTLTAAATTQWQFAYGDYFRSGTDGWAVSSGGVLNRSLVGSNYILHNCCVNNATYRTQQFLKSFDLSGIPHTEVKVKFVYYFLDSWDGGSERGVVDVSSDGSFYSTVWQKGHHVERGSVNYTGVSYLDHWIFEEATVAHSANTLYLRFRSTLDSNPSDESYGFSHVEIYAR